MSEAVHQEREDESEVIALGCDRPGLEWMASTSVRLDERDRTSPLLNRRMRRGAP